MSTAIKIIFVYLITAPLAVTFAQEKKIDFGNVNFFLSPKIAEGGSITDFGLGLKYSDRWGGELSFRYATITKNEELQDASDSINVIDENIIEIFLLPANYKLYNISQTSFYLGGGVYYEFDKLKEKGFFNMPSLENLGKERVNSYDNDFLMHVTGPLLKMGFDHKAKYFNASLSGSIVPLFFLASSQKMGIKPLLDPNYAEYSQNTTGSPYLFADVDVALFKYINIGFHYNFVHLNYKTIDFDTNLDWYNPERKVDTRSIKIDGSILIPLSSDMSVQIGYGYILDIIKFDSSSRNSNRQYVIFTVKKEENKTRGAL
jgi:hypothetical protein